MALFSSKPSLPYGTALFYSTGRTSFRRLPAYRVGTSSSPLRVISAIEVWFSRGRERQLSVELSQRTLDYELLPSSGPP